MEVATLPVEERSVKGTNAVRQLRDTGKIPMVLYGCKGESVSLQADYDSVKRHLTHRLRVYKLELGGKEHPSFLKSVQWDCLTDEPLHLDFLRIKMDEPLKLEIRIVTVGHRLYVLLLLLCSGGWRLSYDFLAELSEAMGLFREDETV